MSKTTTDPRPHWFNRAHEAFIGRLDARMKRDQQFRNVLAAGRANRAAREAADHA